MIVINSPGKCLEKGRLRKKNIKIINILIYIFLVIMLFLLPCEY